MIHDYDTMFKSHVEQSERRQANADLMAEILWAYLQPKSVIDLGCGLGFFLRACKAKGASIKGVDGDWIDPEDSVVPKSVRQVADLNRPYKARKRYDLATTIEVAEHLSPERSEGFVDDLCALSDVVLFSAGVPGQGGAGHINLRFQGEWAEMFQDRGYACYDPIRRRIASFDAVLPWLMQNVLLYVKDGVEVSPSLAEHRIHPRAASYVCDWHYNRRIKTFQRRLRAARKKT
ncbi:methyltransferase domain-containing protein [Nioella aestuarii]|uniref:methyltransferase domain-containing protein n=1 Tax=Nioella aestuarii TaxID=1662864 RepID=UPI003D7F6273